MTESTSIAEKHIREIMALNQELNEKSFAEIIRRLSPLDTWPTRMDGLASEIKDLQKEKAKLDGKGNQKDVDEALKNANAASLRANISIVITVLLFLLTIWNMLK